MSEVIVKIQPSAMRRGAGIVMLCLCACVMIRFAFSSTTQSSVLTFTLTGLSLAFLWQAWISFRSSGGALILKCDGLFDHDDTLICSLSNIALVDTGWFSFKPSNGFLLRLHEPVSRRWSPGLYWRIGRRLGVGGSISPVQTKQMSDKLLLLLQEKTLAQT